MPEDKTIANVADPRVEDSDYVYTGYSEKEELYLDNSTILYSLYENGLNPDGIDVNNFDTQEELNAFLARLPLSYQLRSDIYSNEITKPTSKLELDPLLIDANGKTPIESTVLVYDPKTYNIPSIRGEGQGLSIDDSTMRKALINDPPEGKTIPQVVRTSEAKDVIPVFLDMIDSNMTRQGIYIGDDTIITTLKFSPNPQTFTINSSKKINRYMTMTRWVEEHWGDDMDSVSLNGSTFSFFGYLGPDSPLNTGLTNTYRSETQAYEYMKALVKFFQVNGCLYQSGSDYEQLGYLSVSEFLSDNPEFSDNHPRKGTIKERMYLRLSYDYLVLIGRFESFDLIEDSNMPYRFQYSAVFKAEKTIYTLDRTDTNGGTYPTNDVNPLGQPYDDVITSRA